MEPKWCRTLAPRASTFNSTGPTQNSFPMNFWAVWFPTRERRKPHQSCACSCAGGAAAHNTGFDLTKPLDDPGVIPITDGAIVEWPQNQDRVFPTTRSFSSGMVKIGRAHV